jgi:hypothetical protein
VVVHAGGGADSVESRRFRYSSRMIRPLRPGSGFARMNVSAFLLASSLAASTLGLAACDDTTGGYPPPPPPYQPPAAALDAAKSEKFQPLVKALIAQRAAAKALADHAASGSGDQQRYQELFGKSRAASKAIGEAVTAANLDDAEKRTWNDITSLDDATLATLAK